MLCRTVIRKMKTIPVFLTCREHQRNITNLLKYAKNTLWIKNTSIATDRCPRVHCGHVYLHFERSGVSNPFLWSKIVIPAIESHAPRRAAIQNIFVITTRYISFLTKYQIVELWLFRAEIFCTARSFRSQSPTRQRTNSWHACYWIPGREHEVLISDQWMGWLCEQVVQKLSKCWTNSFPCSNHAACMHRDELLLVVGCWWCWWPCWLLVVVGGADDLIHGMQAACLQSVVFQVRLQ